MVPDKVRSECDPMFWCLSGRNWEHQALIFKYMVAGLPVHPDLVLPIQKSFESISQTFFQHPSCKLLKSLSTSSLPQHFRFLFSYMRNLFWSIIRIGIRNPFNSVTVCNPKPLVPEIPNELMVRIHDAYSMDSYLRSYVCILPFCPYCCQMNVYRLGELLFLLWEEGGPRARTMQGRTDGKSGGAPRKHIQTPSTSSSTVTSLTVTGGSSRTGNFQNLPTNAFGNLQGTGSGTDRTDYHLDSIPYGIPSKEYRYLQGLKSEGGEHSFFSEASGSNKVLQMESQLENTWPLMSTRVASFSASKSSNDSMLQSDYPQHSFLSSDYASGEAMKEEGQPLRPFFNEWPKGRDSWSGLEDERSNQTAFSQLSSQYPFQCHLLTSLQQALNPHMKSPSCPVAFALLANCKCLFFSSVWNLDRGQNQIPPQRARNHKCYLKSSSEGNKNKKEMEQKVVSQIRDVAHVAEDVIDTFITNVSMHNIRTKLGENAPWKGVHGRFDCRHGWIGQDHPCLKGLQQQRGEAMLQLLEEATGRVRNTRKQIGLETSSLTEDELKTKV
ncbi:Glutamine-Leucine-Glutamine, QLQ [Sesbania bispinosa]|nr:Glutamine-Leucine-Glutamine, QLQ [Sesbania bispinosa]